MTVGLWLWSAHIEFSGTAGGCAGTGGCAGGKVGGCKGGCAGGCAGGCCGCGGIFFSEWSAEQAAQQEGALVAVWRMPRSSLEIAGAGQLSLCLPSSCRRHHHLLG